MGKNQLMVPVMFTVAILVPKKDWIEYLTRENDIFLKSYCGYWLFGCLRTKKGWLCYVNPSGSGGPPKKDIESVARRAWKSGEKLPPDFYVLDSAMAIAAYIVGVKQWGEEWFSKDATDAHAYDYTIQMAMLGEERFG